MLAANGRSNPGAHRTALLRAESMRLAANPPVGPVIAAGSTGSIPATAELLSVIARLPRGAVVLPGLDKEMDDASWSVVAQIAPEPAVLGHPQYGLAKLLRRIGVERSMVDDVVALPPPLARRAALVSESFRPAETTSVWADRRQAFSDADLGASLAGVTLVEAVNERDEAVAIAIALRRAIAEPGKTAALVTGDRELARRVSAELKRFGIRADDSGGTPLAATPPAALLRLMVRAVFQPGDPVAVLSLLKHPLLALGLERVTVRHAAETIELVALRGGTGRPEAATLAVLFETRLEALARERPPFWLARLSQARLDTARDVLGRLLSALAPIAALVGPGERSLADDRARHRGRAGGSGARAQMAALLHSTTAMRAKSSQDCCAALSRPPLPIPYPEVSGRMSSRHSSRPKWSSQARAPTAASPSGALWKPACCRRTRWWWAG